MNSRTRLFVLAALTSLVPLGAGVYSLDPAPDGPSTDRGSATRSGSGSMPVYRPGPDALVPRSIPAAGTVFGRVWTSRAMPRDALHPRDTADASGPDVPTSAADSVGRGPGDVVGAVPRKAEEPDRWEGREA